MQILDVISEFTQFWAISEFLTLSELSMLYPNLHVILKSYGILSTREYFIRTAGIAASKMYRIMRLIQFVEVISEVSMLYLMLTGRKQIKNIVSNVSFLPNSVKRHSRDFGKKISEYFHSVFIVKGGKTWD